MNIRRLTFTVPGEPIAKGRARVDGRGKRPRIFTPPETVAYEKRVNLCAATARMATAVPGVEPWPMHASAYLVLANVYVGRRNPDADNVFKSLADGMIGALYADDKRVGGFFPPPAVAAVPRVELVVIAVESATPWLETDRLLMREAIDALCRMSTATCGMGSHGVVLAQLFELLLEWRKRGGHVES